MYCNRVVFSFEGPLCKRKLEEHTEPNSPTKQKPMDSSKYKFPTKWKPRKRVRHLAAMFTHDTNCQHMGKYKFHEYIIAVDCYIDLYPINK